MRASLYGVDKTDSTKIYNETTVMTAQTADVVTLIPVYSDERDQGADGSVIAEMILSFM